MSLSALSLGLAGCGAPAANTTNIAAKPANAVAVNTNVAVNTPAPATDGTVIKIDEAGLVMTVPAGFKFSKDGEDTVVQTEDEGVDIRFTVPKDGDYSKIVGDAVDEIDSYLDNVKVEDKGSKVDVDGMEGTSMSGTAKNEGEDVVWDLTIINTPKKPILVNIYAEKSSMEKHGAAVTAFLKSVKKQ